jgi:hypothetical protein
MNATPSLGVGKPAGTIHHNSDRPLKRKVVDPEWLHKFAFFSTLTVEHNPKSPKRILRLSKAIWFIKRK